MVFFWTSRKNLSPHALQSVREPSGPRRQLGVFDVPHSLHIRAIEDSFFARDWRIVGVASLFGVYSLS